VGEAGTNATAKSETGLRALLASSVLLVDTGSVTLAGTVTVALLTIGSALALAA